jgi:hypothetical protein
VPDTQLGQALLDVPMGDIVERMARAIANAQRSLDVMSIETAMELGFNTLDLHDASGAAITRSLLELGFLPTFYSFTETTIDVSVALSIRTSEDFNVGGTFSIGTPIGGSGGTGGTGGIGGTGTRPVGGTGTRPAGGTGPAGPAGQPTSAASLGTSVLGGALAGAANSTMFGVTLHADYTRRYAFDSSAASKVSTKLVAVPGPPAFLQALRTNFGIGSGH